MIKNKYEIKGDEVYIELSNTKEICIIDIDDINVLENITWYGKDGKWDNYARGMKNGKEVKMHRLIMGISDPNIQVDHINGNTLDNRKINLRESNNATNHMNQSVRSDNKSGFKGVSKRKNKWMARIGKNGKINLGTFNTPEEAAKAYDAKAKELFGEYAKLNFPDEH
jgi:hypothetical protein